MKICTHLLPTAILLLLFAHSGCAQSWKVLSDRIDSLYNTGQMKKAYELSIVSQQQAEREFGKTHANYGISLSVTGQMLQEAGDYAQAEKLMKQGVEVIEQSATPDGEDYSFAITVLGGLYRLTNKIPEALVNLDKALQIRGRLYGLNSEKYTEILTLLSVTHSSVGQYELAIAEMNDVLAIRRKLYGSNHPAYGETVGNLGSIYVDIDNYIQAEPLLEEASRIREATVGKDNVYYWYTVNNLAALKSRMGDHEGAIRLEKELLTRMGKASPQTDLYVSTLGLLATDYFYTNRYEQADSAYSANLTLTEKMLGRNHVRYSSSLHGRAVLYERAGRFDDARKLYQEAVAICQASVGNQNDQYLAKATQLAGLYAKTGEYARADSIYAQLIQTSKQVMGPSSISYGKIVSGQLASYRLQHDIPKTLQMLNEATKVNETTLTRQLPYWTPYQRETYMARHLPTFWGNLSAMADLQATNDISGLLFQQGLSLKNLLLNQQTTTVSTVLLSNNQAWLTMYRAIQDSRGQIATQYTLPIAQRKNLDSLEARAETLEKDLARQSATFRQAKQALQVRWTDIRDALKPTEAAVEFVSFPYFDGRRQTDTVRYMALVLRPGDRAPQVVPLLTDEAPLRHLLSRKKGHSGGNALYATRGSEIDTDQLSQGDSLYQLIWQPIEKLLDGAKTVYLAPSGLLHQVAFAALPYHDNSAKKGVQYLADRYQLRQVGSTRQVVTPATEDDTYQQMSSAKLYGGIQYDSVGSKAAQNGAWPFLPGTQQEVEQISQFVGPKASAVIGFAATETGLKALSGKAPTVLHIATHGFVFPDPAVSQTDSSAENGGDAFRRIANPLFRTGLLMAGANRAWKGGRPTPGDDDGILTAYEVATMSLSATKLVVLSACETALGDIRGSEGVFGLQRAFKMAGVDYLLMSLWPVSDQSTSELMTQFYRNWKKHKTIRLAFQQTQAEMRRKYPPAVWAAFVLIE